MARPVTDLQRTVAPFTVVAPYEPSGDQPAAIADIAITGVVIADIAITDLLIQ